MITEIWTDGGCEPNPGIGGWAAIILRGDEVLEISGLDGATTNNRMEMTAAIRALERCDGPVLIHSDSAYLVHGITKWLAGWKRNDWKRKGKNPTPLSNVDLWKRLDELCTARSVQWKHVRGHAGAKWNERADELATAARKSAGLMGLLQQP